jgi:hypothetical protein
VPTSSDQQPLGSQSFRALPHTPDGDFIIEIAAKNTSGTPPIEMA